MSETAQGPSRAAVESAVEQFEAASAKRDAAGVAGCFAEDGVHQSPWGTFRGRSAIAEFHEWTWRQNPEMGVREEGLGARVFGPVAVVEGVGWGVSKDGVRWELPLLSVFEFDERAKITRAVLAFDRWQATKQVAEQTTGVKGAALRRMVHSIDEHMTAGLPPAG